MSVLQRLYDLQQTKKATSSPSGEVDMVSCSNSTPTNHEHTTQVRHKLSFIEQVKAYMIGLILGVLVAGSALIVIVVLWQRPRIILTTTTTTTSTTESSTSTTTTATTTTSTTSVTTTTSTTTTTAPPWSLCVNGAGQSLTNETFIYSPTSQNYAAGILNNQFGVYQAAGYGRVTSTAIWTAPQTTTSVPCWLALQVDRNLVVYSSVPMPGSIILWTPRIENNGTGSPFCLRMLDTGNLIWINSTLDIVWESNSAVATG